MRLAVLPALIASLILAGCGANASDDDDDDSDERSTIRIEDPCSGEEAYATMASYVGTELTVTAQYGACAPKRIWPCWNGELYFNGPAPTFTDIAIRREPGDSECLELETSTTTFSIAPIVDGDGPLAHQNRYNIYFSDSAGSTAVEWHR
jgi:hypothetical protein